GVWEVIAADAEPIRDMVITDSRLQDVVRPVFLSFDGDVEPGEPFAHMVENGPLLEALLERAKLAGVTLRPAALEEFHASGNSIGARLSDGACATPRRLVAADGARTAIRERAGIASRGWSYDQSAIVTTVAQERDHEGRAEEHFLPAGPFAILPLK